ncbi:hypothetical protein [Sinorhizobium alkalisoli]|uniref:hypothetical protein n=1 Tax=Sinorhizobium alkalisoli TaxID=1752398 RepID=UPI0010425691|nr:hypothetical protein [Sinorhizobium alkalisoli]
MMKIERILLRNWKPGHPFHLPETDAVLSQATHFGCGRTVRSPMAGGIKSKFNKINVVFGGKSAASSFPFFQSDFNDLPSSQVSFAINSCYFHSVYSLGAIGV